MCSEGRPRWFAGEFVDDLVGLAVEHLNDPGANQLLGRDMEPVSVALDRIMKPGGWVAEFSQQCWLRWAPRHERGSAAESRLGCGVRRCRVG